VTKISIVIPTYNGASWLEEGLTAIFKQTIADQLEVLIIDSGSQDETLEILKKFPVCVHQIPNEEFNHGTTRNLGVKLAKGEFILMTVQDARPASDQWLEQMLSNFTSKKVAAVCGGQAVPHEKDKNPIEWHRPQSTPISKSYVFDSSLSFDQLSPEQKNKICRWDNVNALYRKKVLEYIPFRSIQFGEDIAWSIDALRAGKELVFDPAAKVFHYHHQSPSFTYKRTYSSAYARYQLLDYVLPPPPELSIKKVLRWIKTLLIDSPEISMNDYSYWIQYNRNLIRYKRKALQDFHAHLQESDEALSNFHNELNAKSPVSLNIKE
jgi:rhamnosyltransferase